MPRPMSSAMLAWLSGSSLQTAIFFTATFTSGPVYMWSGFGPITWNGQTWIGVGTLGGISQISEGSTVEAKGIAVTLSGLDPTMLTNVLTEFQLGLSAAIYIAGFNDGSLIADPILAFSGRTDMPSIDIDGATAKITLNLESRLIDMNVAVDRRYTNEDQQQDYPGDLGMQFVQAIQEMSIFWGNAPTTQANI